VFTGSVARTPLFRSGPSLPFCSYYIGAWFCKLLRYSTVLAYSMNFAASRPSASLPTSIVAFSGPFLAPLAVVASMRRGTPARGPSKADLFAAVLGRAQQPQRNISLPSGTGSLPCDSVPVLDGVLPAYCCAVCGYGRLADGPFNGLIYPLHCLLAEWASALCALVNSLLTVNIMCNHRCCSAGADSTMLLRTGFDACV